MRPFPCNLGFHRHDSYSWGYGFGQLELFCKRCEKRLISLAIGRLAPLADNPPHPQAPESITEVITND